MRSEHPIDWSKIKALTFDIYGTLVDWDTGVIRAARATALGPHIQASDTELLEALEAHHARIEHEKPTMRKSEINTEGLKLYGRDLGLVENGKLTKEEMDQAAKDFGSSIGSFEAFGDTVSKSRSVRLAITFADMQGQGQRHPETGQAFHSRPSHKHGPFLLQRHARWPSCWMPVHGFVPG